MNVRTAFAVLFLAVAPITQAQSQPATITGTITDPTGAVIPNAAVSLVAANGTAHQTKTDYQGHFELAAISGNYILRVSSPGFRASEKPVQLTPTLVAENITLTIGSGGGVYVEPLPKIELLSASLTTTLPLYPMPPFKLRIKKSTHLSYDARVPHS